MRWDHLIELLHSKPQSMPSSPTFMHPRAMRRKIGDIMGLRAKEDEEGSRMFSMTLYYGIDFETGGCCLRAPAEQTGFKIMLSGAATKNMIKALGLDGSVSRKDLQDQKMTCLFKASSVHKGIPPKLTDVSLHSKEHNPLLDCKAADKVAPIDAELFEGFKLKTIPDLSSIRENVWF